MKVKYISPIGKTTPLLFDTFKSIESVGSVRECDVVFFDLFSGLGEYDQEELDYIIENKVPIVFFDAFDYGGCKDGTEEWFAFYNTKYKGEQWCDFFWDAYLNCKFVYFMRKMDKNVGSPDYVFPLELIQYPDYHFPTTTKEELYNRTFDVCFIGAESTHRLNMIDSILNDGRLKINGIFTTKRISHEEWLRIHRKSKFFLEADGGGFGSERPYQLITISPMLKQSNSQLIVNDFEDMVDCIKIGDENGNCTRDEISQLVQVCNSADKLFSIYTKGIEKMKAYFNAEYREQYILSILKQEGICH